MGSSYDFIIVGLGTAGSSTCMTLARRGYTVLGIDAYHPPHDKGSHHGASRSVRRAYMEGTSYVPMALKSWELWRRLEKDSARELLVTTGNLTIGPPESPGFNGFMASAQAYDIPHEYLSGAEVRTRWPQLAPPDGYVAGLEIEAGLVFPELCIATFLEEAEKAGADLVFDEPVKSWQEEQTIVRVHTDAATYEAGRLLISAGAWSRQLLGLEDSPLRPKRVVVHWIEVPENRGFQLGSYPVNFWQVPEDEPLDTQSTYREFYSLPVLPPSTRVKAAFHNGLADCDPAAPAKVVSLAEEAAIDAVISKFLPGLHKCPMRSELCLYTLTPDGHFYLGKRPGSQHVFGAALAGHGFKFAPVLGEILADVMEDAAPEVDISMFSPKRFNKRR